MSASPLRSIIEAGTKLWLDSVDPDLTVQARKLGTTGATSNPIIVGDLIQSGRFDDKLSELLDQGEDDEAIAWHMTDHLVRRAQEVFAPVWQETAGDDGYVSFELDPLLEDVDLGPSHNERVQRYIELGKQWAAGHDNRMIKVPATPAGLDALEELAAAGINLNVTLMFTMRQWEAATQAIWRGAQRAGNADTLKSVYSIFISRVDVYTSKHATDLSAAAQGQVGLVNAKQIWQANQRFWQDKPVQRQQEIVFASTGAKLEGQPADFYIEQLVGSDIQTNPPQTNDAVEQLGKTYERTLDQLPAKEIVEEIEAKIDVQRLEDALMEEGLKKFADPQKELLQVITDRRRTLAQTR